MSDVRIIGYDKYVRTHTAMDRDIVVWRVRSVSSKYVRAIDFKGKCKKHEDLLAVMLVRRGRPLWARCLHYSCQSILDGFVLDNKLACEKNDCSHSGYLGWSKSSGGSDGV